MTVEKSSIVVVVMADEQPFDDTSLPSIIESMSLNNYTLRVDAHKEVIVH